VLTSLARAGKDGIEELGVLLKREMQRDRDRRAIVEWRR
jgi:hypothetical protein